MRVFVTGWVDHDFGFSNSGPDSSRISRIRVTHSNDSQGQPHYPYSLKR